MFENYIKKIVDEIIYNDVEIKSRLYNMELNEIENDIFLQIRKEDYDNIVLKYMEEFENESFKNIDELRGKYNDEEFNEKMIDCIFPFIEIIVRDKAFQ